MNKQEYLIITFHSLDDAMDLDAKQTASMKGRLIPKPSVIDAGCGMCFVYSGDTTIVSPVDA